MRHRSWNRCVVHVAMWHVLAASIATQAGAQELSVQLIGNAGVMVSDGTTSLLVDLPYEPGASGYESYEPATLRPLGAVVAVITHHHKDHFDRSLFVPNESWRIIGPPSVTAGISGTRVLSGDSVTVGAFAITVLPSPHTSDHRSYRIRWKGRVLHFVGDTESVASIPPAPRIDVLFVTPWLQCALLRENRASTWDRAVLYHRRVTRTDEICGAAEPLEQGTRFTMAPR